MRTTLQPVRYWHYAAAMPLGRSDRWNIAAGLFLFSAGCLAGYICLYLLIANLSFGLAMNYAYIAGIILCYFFNTWLDVSGPVIRMFRPSLGWAPRLNIF